MVKNLKLNIKNTQLAEALKLKAAPGKEKKPRKTAAKAATKSAQVKDSTKKPKARILKRDPKEELEEKKIKASQEVEEEKEPIQEEIVEETPVVEEQKVEETIKELPPKEVKKEEKEADLKESEKPKKKVKEEEKKGPSGFKDFREFKAARRKETKFDARDRQGLRDRDDEGWRKKRHKKKHKVEDTAADRPKSLKIRLPITIKDLAHEMKLKASELISKLFMQGITITLNDYLDDETTVQLLGHDFGCEITIDTSEEERIRITDKTIQEEIKETDDDKLTSRAPVITFMGHVDHGKTSLIDAIRKTNRTAQEAGAITQHIGAFRTKTTNGEITILDTPGHEAFTEMRERGATVTDIVVLVVAGDEGMREQTIEAMNQAKEANVPIVVAINKADKESFDPQKVYRELSDHQLLPETWGGTTITINCSAHSGLGVKELLEMVALQSEVLELRANPEERARGSVLESEMHKGLGAVATVLVQNGTLRMGDAVVLGHYFGRIKTMHDEFGKTLQEAGPSTPVKITGISGLAEAGSEFIVVKSDKEAKELASARYEGQERKKMLKAGRSSMDKLIQRNEEKQQKVLPLIIRADVQGSLEALITSLHKIKSKKIRIEVVSEGIGEISESDIELASASKATLLGFHTQVESHAEGLIKQTKVKLILEDVIYHAIDKIKEIMTDMLDRVPEEKDTGKAEVRATFKSSQLGVIAGCQVTEGTISRNHFMRVMRKKEKIWQGKIASLKRVKDDVREVQKGLECGILLDGFTKFEEGDILEAFEIVYHKQEL